MIKENIALLNYFLQLIIAKKLKLRIFYDEKIIIILLIYYWY